MTATLTQPTIELDLRTIPPRERHPLIFCISPALLVVLMGPAMIQMVRTLSGISVGTP